MGFELIEIQIPVNYSEQELFNFIKKNIGHEEFTYQIERKSLDARNKRNIHWNMQIGVMSDALKAEKTNIEKLEIPYRKTDEKIVVVGMGPAGYFAAYILCLAGFKVKLLEQGKNVEERHKDIVSFEKSGSLNEMSNYAFGEGGAGTYSDGKLTSRTKSISLERNFIFDTYIKAGAPEEIRYLSSPHIGSNNLAKMMPQLRKMLFDLGCEICFDTSINGINIKNNRVIEVSFGTNVFDAQQFVFAPGHSNYNTNKMLIKSGIHFRTKAFAIGTRAEHYQQIINKAMWGNENIDGLKAAEYKLTYKNKKQCDVYSFCMCPGGKVVQTTSLSNTSVVNGMSNYLRNSPFANAAIVAGIHPDELFGEKVTPLQAIEGLNSLERNFYNLSGNFNAPACQISDFIQNKNSKLLPQSSYPFELFTHNFKNILPEIILQSLKSALRDFCGKIKGYETGVLIGLESKTSSPIQAVRGESRECEGFDNLYICGEGSGFAGGIVSSAADGIKAALAIINKM